LLSEITAGAIGRPLAWKLGSTSLSNGSAFFSIWGMNAGNQEVRLDDVYLVSGITGERLNLYFNWGGSQLGARDINPIPTGAPLLLFSDHAKVSTKEQLLERWAEFALIAEYDGTKHRVVFDRYAVQGALPKPIPVSPHISPKSKP
jgi:hypothetical protein